MSRCECINSNIYEGSHHSVTSKVEMEDPISRESIMRLIATLITTNVDATSWVANPQVHIPKASLAFPTKVWWVVTLAQLHPIRNANSLSPSQAALISCIMDGYILYVWEIVPGWKAKSAIYFFDQLEIVYLFPYCFNLSQHSGRGRHSRTIAGPQENPHPGWLQEKDLGMLKHKIE